MPTPTHVLVTPVSEGGELVFAHALDSGIRVWMRGLTGPVDERPRRLRGVAAPLYGGTIRDMHPLRDFVADFAEHAVDDPAVPLTPGRIRDTRPVNVRTSSDALANGMHFSYRAMSPLHTIGPWSGAAAELLLHLAAHRPPRRDDLRGGGVYDAGPHDHRRARGVLGVMPGPHPTARLLQ
ncbi:hypothetical protein ACFY9A_37825 [Streptomyces rubradiris]|uniref:hypothetical protein n=1 Tax=Streptomyces rubradiris TaxID=285531 RepID=UPI0036E0D98D